jgi:predicted cupin superfamily sugar epimerase
MRQPANYWIEKLQLTRHIEGGYFKETYRSDLTLLTEQLPATFTGPRNISTSIYYLLEHGFFSAFHRIRSDEQWHFYFGDPLEIFEFQEDGRLVTYVLGSDPVKGQTFQCTIKAGNWFASRPADGSEYCLAGCTVSPGFDYNDFEIAKRDELINKFPDYKDLILQLTSEAESTEL